MIVCFDLGGVLVKINRTWQDAAASAGVRIHLSKDVPVSLMEIEAFNAFQRGEVSDTAYFGLLGEALEVSAADAARVHEFILDTPYPATHELILDLHRLGFTTGCLSNTNEPHWKVMASGLRFPNVAALTVPVVSHEVNLEKPDEAIYRHFEQVSSSKPQDIIFFDDTAVNVDAAKSFGWNAVLIDPFADTASQMREALVPWLLAH